MCLNDSKSIRVQKKNTKEICQHLFAIWIEDNTDPEAPAEADIFPDPIPTVTGNTHSELHHDHGINHPKNGITIKPETNMDQEKGETLIDTATNQMSIQ